MASSVTFKKGNVRFTHGLNKELYEIKGNKETEREELLNGKLALVVQTEYDDSDGDYVCVVMLCADEDFENDLVIDKLRFLLCKCRCVTTLKLAYDLSLSKPTFIQRLVLGANPDINVQLYRELNYTARRMGMFLGFAATTADGSKCFMHRMQIKNFDMFRVIISYM